MANRIQIRRDTSERWTEVNPLLMEGEMGWETDTRKAKMGDGINNWNDLPYITVSDGFVLF